jgi:Fe-S-cluster containining protein
LMTNLNNPSTLLAEIYRIYDDFSTPEASACRKGCSACCTRNVTLTSLEGSCIVHYLNENNRMNLLEKVAEQRHEPRFRPEITLNGLTESLARGEEQPEEVYPLEGKCPLLENDLCAVYPARPFGCRCFQSRRNCCETGYADVDPFTLSVNHLFLQFIEHVDAGGIFANLTDMLIYIASQANLEAYDDHSVRECPAPFIRNRPLSMLFIPPEHRDGIRGLWSKLQGIRVPAA